MRHPVKINKIKSEDPDVLLQAYYKLEEMVQGLLDLKPEYSYELNLDYDNNEVTLLLLEENYFYAN